MNARQLLEERSERGTPRGSANVWTDANMARAEARSTSWSGSLIALRLSLALSVVCLVAAGLSWAGGDDAIVESATQNEVAEDSPGPTTPEPAHLLVDGYTLDHVQAPMMDLVGDEFGSSGIELTRVFADADDPFGQPVLGVDSLDGGGFQPWGVNVSTSGLDALAGDVVRTDDGWGLPAGSDLVEVARFTTQPADALRHGWQFDHADGSNGATLQAQPDDDAGLWVWVALLARSEVDPIELSEFDVLGNAGVVLARPPWAEDQPAFDEVVWAADGFAYRLTANELTKDTEWGRSASEVTGLLTVVDNTDWANAVGDAGRTSTGENAAIWLGLLTMAGWLLSSIWFLVRGPWQLAIFGLVVVLTSLFFFPDLLMALIAALALVVAWFAARRREGQPTPGMSEHSSS